MCVFIEDQENKLFHFLYNKSSTKKRGVTGGATERWSLLGVDGAVRTGVTGAALTRGGDAGGD